VNSGSFCNLVYSTCLLVEWDPRRPTSAAKRFQVIFTELPMMPCPPPERWLLLQRGELSASESKALTGHQEQCERCRNLFHAELTRTVANEAEVSEESGALVVLDVVEGPNAGAHFVFDRHATFLVGRAPDANLQLLEDAHFSRYHFVIETNPPRCFLRDLGSRNGTFVNEQRVSSCHLRSGDIISGGRTRIRVRLEEPVLPPTLAQSPGEPGWPTVPGPTPIAPVATRANKLMAEPDVPGYEMLRLLGQGGMGRVYLARQQSSDQLFAIKTVLPESAASPVVLKRFLREISVLSQLQHQRIVRFHETGLAQGMFYFVMEYVLALSVRECLADLEDEARARIICGLVAQALDGLGYAHELGFVHRDVKPTNLLVYDAAGKLEAKVADFGLAKQFESAGLSGMTHDGQMVGTLHFMAPEQVTRSRWARPSADIYGAGATLYHLLTQQPPYDFQQGRDPLAILLEGRPVSLAARLAAAPPGLAAVLDRALAKDPADRFASAEEFRTALAPFC
jgi:serine/threonine-protein kinase